MEPYEKTDKDKVFDLIDAIEEAHRQARAAGPTKAIWLMSDAIEAHLPKIQTLVVQMDAALAPRVPAAAEASVVGNEAPTTDAVLNELEILWKKLKPGDWHFNNQCDEIFRMIPNAQDDDVDAEHVALFEDADDALFIELAQNHMPALLARVRMAEAKAAPRVPAAAEAAGVAGNEAESMVGGRSYCMGIDVAGALIRGKKSYKGLVSDENDNVLSPRDTRAWLVDELQKGHKVLPMGECDNWDYTTGCKGHAAPADAA